MIRKDLRVRCPGERRSETTPFEGATEAVSVTLATMKRTYQQPDDATLYREVWEPAELRQMGEGN